MKRSLFTILLLIFSAVLFSQSQAEFATAQPEIQTIKVFGSKYLSDFIPKTPIKDQFDIEPGILPEGDNMLHPSFTNDGSKVLVPNGASSNVTVFDSQTLEVITNIDVGYFPCDVAVSDDYAVVPCIFDNEIYVVDIQDFSIAAIFPASEQPCRVQVSPDGAYAYVACDIDDKCEVIDLSTLTHIMTMDNFEIGLLSFSWVTGNGRTSFTFTNFEVTPDGNYLLAADWENNVLYYNTQTGAIDDMISGIPNCSVVRLSGDGNKAVALSLVNSEVTAYQLDVASKTKTDSLTVNGYGLYTYDAAVNLDGSKVYLGTNNNTSTLVNFNSSNYTVFNQTYSAFWLGTNADHTLAIGGQYRFSIVDFATETILDQSIGRSQSIGTVSPAGNYAVGFDNLRYEGVYFYDFTDPSDIVFQGKKLSGKDPEGDTPYRVAIAPDGSKAVVTNTLSESASIIDLTTKSVDTILNLDEKSDAVAITSDSYWAVLGGYDLNTVKIIDLSTNEYVTSVATGQRPLMVSISPDDQYAYVGNIKSNSVSVVELNGAASTEIEEIYTGVIGVTWAANGVRSDVRVSPTGDYVLVAASFDDKVQVIDATTNQIVADLPTGDFPLQVAFNSTGDYAVVSNYNGDSYTIMNIDGANSSVVGTFPSNGESPLRVAYNAVNDEFSVINYSTKTIIHVDPQTGDINNTDYYSQHGSPVQILFDENGESMVLTLTADNIPARLIRGSNIVDLPANPSFFDYCQATKTAVVTMPGPDYVTIVEYDPAPVPPVADFTADVFVINVGESVSFTDLSTGNPTSWEWDFYGGTPSTSVEQNPVVTYENAGDFDVSLTVSNSAGSDTKGEMDYILVLPYPGLDENHDEPFSLSVQKKTIRIEFETTVLGAEVEITDLSGNMVLQNTSGSQEIILNAETLASGIYLISIVVDNQRYVRKIRVL